MILRFGLLAAGVLSIGCNVTKLTKTGSPHPARPADCTFDMLSSFPPSYEELGTINVNAGIGSNPRSLGTFQNKIRENVCAAGGNAAVANPDQLGVYRSATVILRRAPKSSPTAGAGTGCQYDTQCKGDRVCVDGKCESP